MLSKKEIKDIQSLGHKKNRDELGYFLAEGPKMVAEFIQLLPERIVKIYAVQEWIKENESKLKQLPVQEISPLELVRLSQMQTPHQVLCIIKQFEHKEPAVKDTFSIYLDAIHYPGNL
jgi:TrmH family RNA methyltransferase